ncbi:hypothetical protein MNBD_GAMMA10-1255, partial [hydrothermal vent metagenome]
PFNVAIQTWLIVQVDTGMFITIKLILAGILSVILLTSCAYPVKNVPTSYQLNNKSALVVVSLTISDECAQGKGHGYAYFTEIRETNTRQTYSIAMQGFGNERDWERQESECSTDRDNYYGRLVSIELPVGSYEIYQFEGISGHSKSYGKNEISVKFSVRENSVNYIGNIHFHVAEKEIMYNVKNMFQRDIAYFQKKYPQFDKSDIITDLLQSEKNIQIEQDRLLVH